MRQFGWLEQVLPDVAMLRGNLLSQLRDPAMVALIQAAPVPLIPPLRSICWMLKLKPPPILALPKRPKAPRPEAPKPQPQRQEPPARRLPPEVLAKWPHASPLLRRAGLRRWREQGREREGTSGTSPPKPA